MAITTRSKTNYTPRGPDLLMIDVHAALPLVGKQPMGFNQIFEAVYTAQKEKGKNSTSEEMLRLRTYEKLQNLVQRGFAEKIGKEYTASRKEYQPAQPVA
jgi:hypothetical protein